MPIFAVARPRVPAGAYSLISNPKNNKIKQNSIYRPEIHFMERLIQPAFYQSSNVPTLEERRLSLTGCHLSREIQVANLDWDFTMVKLLPVRFYD